MRIALTYNCHDDIEELETIKGLTELYLFDCPKIKKIPDCQTLEILEIANCNQIKEIPNLRNLKQLKFTGFTGGLKTGFPNNGCKRIPKIDSLVNLEIDYLDVLPELKNLDTLTLRHYRGDTLELISPNLRYVSMYFCHNIKSFPKLLSDNKVKLLKLHNCSSLEDIESDDFYSLTIENCPNLKMPKSKINKLDIDQRFLDSIQWI